MLGIKEGFSFSLKMILVNLGHVASIATEKSEEAEKERVNVLGGTHTWFYLYKSIKARCSP